MMHSDSLILLLLVVILPWLSHKGATDPVVKYLTKLRWLGAVGLSLYVIYRTFHYPLSTLHFLLNVPLLYIVYELVWGNKVKKEKKPPLV